MMLVICLLIGYFVTTLFGYVTHWALHQKWMGRFYKSHQVHHNLYPITSYLSDSYRVAGKDSTVWFYIVTGMPLVLVPFLLYYFSLTSFVTSVILCVWIIFLGLCHNYIHDSFHIKTGFFRTTKIFKSWNKYHILHHRHMQSNFGIFSFWADKLFKTFKTKLK